MGKRWRKTPFVLLGLLVLFAAGQAFAAAVVFDPAAQTKTLGQQAIVDIVFQGADAGNHLGGYDLTMNYNSSVVSLAGVAFGVGLDGGFGFSDQISTPSAGSLNLYELSFLSAQDLIDYQSPLGDFMLARLTFNTVGLGTSPLEISWSIFGDAYGDEIFPDLVGGSITVVQGGGPAVPEPATMVLLGSGLAGLGIWRKKR